MRWTLSIVLCVISLPVLASAWVNVTVSTPANNSTVTSPVLIAASATSNRSITGWRIYVDGTSVYHAGSTNSIRTSVSMAPGAHKVIIRAWASNGTYGSVTLTETVGSSTPGSAQGTVTPTSLAFGSVAINTSSSSQSVKITNTGSATLNISGVSISPSQFAVSGSTSTSIAPGSSAAYNLTFSPTAVSPYSGTLSFSTNSATAVPAVTLSGTGVNQTPSPTPTPTPTPSPSPTPTPTATPTPIALTTSSLPGAIVGTAYKATLTASGGTPPYTWTVVSGQLPSGLNLSGTGVISGTPTASGNFAFSIQVKDSASSPQAATGSESINVAAGSPSACSGTCYYLSPTGSDSNLGTSPSSPWRTIAKLKAFQANLVPGDSVLLQRGGVWSEQLDITNMNGSSGFPITIGNYGTGNLPVIDGGQTSSATGRDYCIDALNTTFKWVTIDGIECRNAYKMGMTFQAYSGRGTNGVGIVVQNSYIHHSGAGACASCGSTPAAESGYYNQLDAQDTTGVQFLNNTLDHLGGHNALNVHFDLGGPVVSGNVVGTVAPFCNHNCIDVKGPVGGQIKNNIVTCPGCNANTAAFYTENVYTPASDLTYTGNIAYNVPVGFQNQTGGTCQSSPCSINAKYYNNTVYHSSQYAFYAGTCTNHTLNIQKNIFDGGAVAINSGCSTTWDYNDDGGVFAITGNPVGPHDLKQINPQYVNPAGGNFTPQNTTILTYGASDTVTSFPYLGGLQ